MNGEFLKSLMMIWFISNVCLLKGQTKEIEEMWGQQSDQNKGSIQKAMYLEIDEGKIVEMFNNQPSFTMYMDNYFITGMPTNKKTTKHNADAKFQISVRQRLTKTILPFNTFLILTYTQKAFWNLYEESCPFVDCNYNPGLTLGKPLIHNNQFKGMASIAFEHESNGKDSLDSRSWNYFVLSGMYFFNMNISVQGKLWAGWLSDNNRDLYKYRGYGLMVINYRNTNDRIGISAVINPRRKIGNFNTQLDVSFKINPKSNQYLFVQWYNGYGESLLAYNQHTSMIRLGICIKHPLRNLY